MDRLAIVKRMVERKLPRFSKTSTFDELLHIAKTRGVDKVNLINEDIRVVVLRASNAPTSATFLRKMLRVYFFISCETKRCGESRCLFVRFFLSWATKIDGRDAQHNGGCKTACKAISYFLSLQRAGRGRRTVARRCRPSANVPTSCGQIKM